MNTSSKVVYHASRSQGLTLIKPSTSTHNRKWVYATRDIAVAAAFLSPVGGDFTCAIGRDHETGRMFVCERFQGAFDLRYEGVSGSIYVLPGELFMEAETHWDEEVISEHPIRPIREIRVANVKEYLLSLADEEKLILRSYPDKMPGIPDDDEDLVYRAAIWHKPFGEKVLEQVKMFHPALLSRVLQAIENKRY